MSGLPGNDRSEWRVMSTTKGFIRLLAWVHCGGCEYHTPADFNHPATTHTEAVIQAGKLGWHHTRAKGWVCPECWREVLEQRKRDRGLKRKKVANESNS